MCIRDRTKDIIFIDERKVQPDKCVTVPNSIITLFQEINAAVAEAIGCLLYTSRCV